MNYFTPKRLTIHPEDQNDLAYWTRKWGVNVRQINDAILETGSLRLDDIRNVLIKKGSLGSVSLWLHKFFGDSLTLH
ncbi:hypothetical protein CNR22_14160 [Sphingobacteriaceae bacterium]|nr:hypothetical protein CNR22_14160 [Sphingobacteriaceae bacterium]